jgi:hypothetical protein
MHCISKTFIPNHFKIIIVCSLDEYNLLIVTVVMSYFYDKHATISEFIYTKYHMNLCNKIKAPSFILTSIIFYKYV